MTADRPCKACGVPLRFVKSAATGRLIPLQRIKAAYCVFVDGAGSDEARAIDPGGHVYVSHFETCPSAGSFSRRAR